MRTLRSKIALIILLILLYFATLWGKQLEFTSRSLTELWNLGHIPLFFLITYFLLKYYPGKFGENKLTQIVYLILVTLLIGLLIEYEQFLFSNGTPDLRDLYKDMLGTFLGYIILKKQENQKVYYWAKVLLVVLILFEVTPILKAATDEIRAYNDFPILADFENNLELERWRMGGKSEISEEHVTHGISSLKIKFDTSRYSTISLTYFPGNWSDYSCLKCDFFNPNPDSAKLIFRLNDSEHNVTNHYSDRFNRKFILAPGWNNLVISLKDVELSPESRRMNMTSISNLAFFTVKLPKEKTLFLDYIRLE